MRSRIFDSDIDSEDQQDKATAMAALQDALWEAAKAGNKEQIRKLVVEGADVTATDPDGQNALDIASQHGHVDAHKTLLAAEQMQLMIKAGVHYNREAA